jgi:hypothetical protein
MRSWKLRLSVAVATVLAVAVTVLVRRSHVVEALLMILIGKDRRPRHSGQFAASSAALK